jgi:hypothetical protein
MYRYSCTRVRRGRRCPGLALATAACVPTRCTTGLAQAACEPIGWPVRGETPASSCVALTGAQTALHFVRWRTSVRGRPEWPEPQTGFGRCSLHAFPSSQTGEDRTLPTHRTPAGSGPFSPGKSSSGPPAGPSASRNGRCADRAGRDRIRTLHQACELCGVIDLTDRCTAILAGTKPATAVGPDAGRCCRRRLVKVFCMACLHVGPDAAKTRTTRAREAISSANRGRLQLPQVMPCALGQSGCPLSASPRCSAASCRR